MQRSKPFIKWVGGKGGLTDQLARMLPRDLADGKGLTYVEPFVGGGAMLFFMLRRHTGIRRAIVCDVNADLTTCYRTVRDTPDRLIKALGEIEREYLALANDDARRDFYLAQRKRYNLKGHGDVDNTVMFLFLNRTCFNGMYRVNRSGGFNVPFGRYERPQICDADTILADSAALQRVEIMTGDFEGTLSMATERSFFYLDPPYRPISATSAFTSYTVGQFNDEEQERLCRFCHRLDASGHRFMLSNSDGLPYGDDFLRRLYSDYNISTVSAARSINCKGTGRGRLSEIVVRNYNEPKKYTDDFILEPYYVAGGIMRGNETNYHEERL